MAKFRKRIEAHRQKVYENYDTYYGVLHLKVRRSANLKYRILGLIDAMKKASIIKPT